MMNTFLMSRVGALVAVLALGLGSAQGAGQDDQKAQPRKQQPSKPQPPKQQASQQQQAKLQQTRQEQAQNIKGRAQEKGANGARLDRSGRKQVGKASYYARMFHGRKMADGTPMKPHSNNAASKTLPLGTTAKVTNLETNESAKVTIRDRGPYVPGRIVDLSPSTAQDIGITPKEGVAVVEVAPIAVPMPDGSVKPGAGAR